MKNKKQFMKQVKQVWDKCEKVLNDRSMVCYGDTLLRLNRQESKDHDRWRSDGIGRGITVTEESKYFALKNLAEYVYGLEKAPDVKAYHYMRKALFYAYSLAEEYRIQLKEVISLEFAKELHNSDYCELIAVGVSQ